MADSHKLRSRRVVLPDEVRPATLVIRNGVIEAISDEVGDDVEDLVDLVIMPGLVDIHVHINEPGRTDWEGFETATTAAVAGGVTTLVDMPLNSSPVTTTVDALSAKREAAKDKCKSRVEFYGGLVPGNSNHIQDLINGGVRGIKAFLCPSGIDEFPNATEADLRAAMPILARADIPLLVHAELVESPKPLADPNRYSEYLASRPAAWEMRAIELMIRLCKETNCPVHIVHLSAAEALPMLREARDDEGLPITVETCPHYLFFAAEEIENGRTDFKCAPPIRGADNQQLLWQAIEQGDIDLIASDHSPCPPEMKRLDDGNFGEAWGGISSVQLTLPVMWTKARERNVDLPTLARWLCSAPAERIGYHDERGTIGEGMKADLVLWNPDTTFHVESDGLRHRHKVTPYLGRELFGLVQRTYVNGELVYGGKKNE